LIFKAYLCSRKESQMKKRDAILVVFRVAAILIFLYAIAKIPDIIWQWTRVSTIGNVSLVGPFIIHIITRFVLEIGIPLIMVFLLWKKSGWFTSKILVPFGEDSKFSEVESEQKTTLQLTRVEIESLAFTVIGVWLLTSSLPGLAEQGANFFDPRVKIGYLIYLIEPLVKTLLGIFLVFRSTSLAAWLSKRRESRMTN